MSKEMKLMPELRFLEFDRASEWQLQPLRKVLIKNSKKNKSLKHNLVQSVSNKHGFINQEDYFDNRRVASKDTSNYYVIKKGYFAYNPSRIDVGSLAYQHENITSIISPLYVSFQANYEEVDDIFLLNWFFSNQFSSQLIFEGGVRNSLSYENLVQINITLPSIPEQQKIASCLSSLDELIAAHKDKLDALKDHKKGLLQNLFPQEGETAPKVRFPEFEGDGEWVEKKLGKIAENLDSKRIPITSTKREKGVIPYYGASGIIDYVKDYIFDEDLLLISEDGANLVARVYPIAFSITGKTWVNNHAHVLKFENWFTQVLVEMYLNSKNIENFLTGMAQPKLNRKKLDIIPIPIPKNPKEQQKIATCLSAVDELITAQQEKIEQLQLHKKGLMKGLFPKIES
ncbi:MULTISPECIES: restriction endonuclease subunit S [unclassified Algoriphagus]|jgi:type I restriction enzyme S subunit|uniref:restriction endonuclease subunit S n=1 Tax=unclassified Algoriphagus TaxID=2641541 RepID=UPI00257FAAE6|nr:MULTISPECIES: restriction endonuclease subunit S [unclassified Algoriphagus]|tara:strand:+ start:1819 stop:3018 length:1200 start_codon:yes stop_codon:yes gene_type:complete